MAFGVPTIVAMMENNRSNHNSSNSNSHSNSHRNSNSSSNTYLLYGQLVFSMADVKPRSGHAQR